jgi:hypothetical protein
MRAGVRLMAGLLAGALGAAGALAQAASCQKADFEAVVDEAAVALTELVKQNTPPFQAKLRQLRDKRGWSHDEFLKQAAPYVRDEEIALFDKKSEELLARITGGSQTGAGPPDCAQLGELRAALKVLLETQKAKWAYMVAKIDKELAK